MVWMGCALKGELMDNDDVTIDGIEMPSCAAKLVEMTGCSPSADVQDLRAGVRTAAQLLEHCLDGCEDESDGVAWGHYVDAIVAAVDEPDEVAWDQVDLVVTNPAASGIVVTTQARLSCEHEQELLDFIKVDPNNGSRSVTFETGDFMRVDCPDLFFGCELFARVRDMLVAGVA
jgi:hypothetical protein